MDVIGHDDKWTEAIVAKLDTAMNGIANELGERRLAQEQRTPACRVELAVDPDEGPSRGCAAEWRVMRPGQTAVEVPRDQQPTVLAIHVR
jgi:hypothetical protein